MNLPPPKLKMLAGQTLIETMVAIFILVTGVTAALSLAVYALDTSSNINKQIIGTGLAREAIEAVKNMRDTNWLKGTLSTNCYDYAKPGQNDANCYLNWLNQSGGYNIDPGNVSSTYTLSFNPTSAWNLVSSTSYGLDFTQFNNTNFSGFYVANNHTTGTPDPDGTYYYRKIIITPDASAPYLLPPSGEGPELLVTSQVWWTDKNCPQSKDWPGAGKCSVELDTTLTNWKDY